MDRFNHNGLDRLRKGRVSIPHSRYFITLCTRSRIPRLQTGQIPGAITKALRKLHKEGDIALICSTVMPDHFHALYRLGHKLTLAQVQGKFKSLTGSALESERLEWQQNYFDHRLRERIPADRFARYIFMNPYKKGLIDHDQTWPEWRYNRARPPEFMKHLDDGRYPLVEWLNALDSAVSLIAEDLETDPNPDSTP